MTHPTTHVQVKYASCPARRSVPPWVSGAGVPYLVSVPAVPLSRQLVGARHSAQVGRDRRRRATVICRYTGAGVKPGSAGAGEVRPEQRQRGRMESDQIRADGADQVRPEQRQTREYYVR